MDIELAVRSWGFASLGDFFLQLLCNVLFISFVCLLALPLEGHRLRTWRGIRITSMSVLLGFLLGLNWAIRPIAGLPLHLHPVMAGIFIGIDGFILGLVIVKIRDTYDEVVAAHKHSQDKR